MKTRLEVVIKLVERLRDDAHDDELTDELDNALIHLEAASDRLTAMEEEEEEEDPGGEIDRLYDQERDPCGICEAARPHGTQQFPRCLMVQDAGRLIPFSFLIHSPTP